MVILCISGHEFCGSTECSSMMNITSPLKLKEVKLRQHWEDACVSGRQNFFLMEVADLRDRYYYTGLRFAF